MTVMLLIFALTIWVSFAVTSDVFMQVGSSVQLNTSEYHGQDFEVFLWLFHNNTIGKYYNDFSKFKLYSPYEGRAVFDEETHSLILNKLQRNDSGFYQAKVIGEINKVVAAYTLTVLDPVQAPVLTPVSHLQSGDACNVTCRGHDLSAVSSCYNETCDEKKVASRGSMALTLSASGTVIKCNLSNPVSWKETETEITQLCTSHGKQRGTLSSNTCHLGLDIGNMLFIILTVLCILK